MGIEQIAQRIVNNRYIKMRDIAQQIVANRKVEIPTPIDVTVNVPKQLSPSQVTNVSAPNVDIVMDVPAPHVKVTNVVEAQPLPAVPVTVVNDVSIPEHPVPIVNLNVPEQAPPNINIQLVVPPEAIKVEVNIPEIKIPAPAVVPDPTPHPSPPTSASIRHSDGTTSTVRLN